MECNFLEVGCIVCIGKLNFMIPSVFQLFLSELAHLTLVLGLSPSHSYHKKTRSRWWERVGWRGGGL